ncbi:hypothetical protein K170097C1_16290 [Hungatella effluvii]
MTEAAFHVTGKGEARGSGVFESCVLICRRNNDKIVNQYEKAGIDCRYSERNGQKGKNQKGWNTDEKGTDDDSGIVPLLPPGTAHDG